MAAPRKLHISGSYKRLTRASMRSPDASASAKRMKAKAVAASNPDQPLRLAAAKIQAFVQQRFDRQVDPSGRPWEPLSDATIESRLRKAGALKSAKATNRRQGVKAYTKGARKKQAALLAPGGITILTDTARLKNNAFASILPGRAAIMVGDNAVYASSHQMGTEDIPRRAFIPIETEHGPTRLWTDGEGGVLWNQVRQLLGRSITLAGDHMVRIK